MEKLGQNNIYSQYLGNKVVLRTYKGTDLINEYVPLYTPPVDWSDIRTDCPENSIALYAGVKSDYSQYDNLGFTATCTGGYKVYIDGEQYGSTYASGAQCSITWSSLALDTGDDITTPTALKAHKIWVEPATEGRNITRFASARVSTGSENELQGKLWIHFNLSNTIQVSNLLRASGTYSVNNICKAITAKNNTLNCAANIGSMCQNGTSLEYVPVLVSSGEAGAGGNIFNGCELLKSITLKNFKFSTFNYGCNNCYLLEKIKHSNTEILNSVNSTINSQYNECCKLQNLLPETYTANITRAQNYIHNTPELKDTVIDLRGATALTELGIFSSNSTYFAKGIKGVRVSNEASFDRANTTQIDVRYTNLDRSALVQLFNDLPYNVGYEVVGSPTINNGVVSGFTTSDYTKTSLSLSSDNEKIRIKIRFKTPETFVSGNTNILTFGNSLTTNNCIRIYTGSSYSRISSFGNDINTGSPNLQTDTFYVVDVLIDGNKQYSYLYDDNNTKLAESTNTTKTANFSNLGFFGGRFYSPIQSIDFNNTSIEVNDIPFFRGQAAMTKTLSCVGATGNMLDIVGSPTITNGIVSGFNSSPRADIVINKELPTSSPFIIQVKVNTGTLLTNRNQWILSTLSATNRSICWGVSTAKKIRIYLSSNGKTWDIASSVDGTHILADNTDYITRLTFDGSKYVVSLLINDEWVDDIIITSSVLLSSQDLRFGQAESGSNFWPGSIDLNETYIKENGETWFDINNCLLPEDKAIATNKNWTLTLS